jgi:voltage-gated potassium channel
MRAVYHDTAALWSQFRRPILIFLLATLGGGFLYGELRVLAGYPRIPYIDLPYMMLQLMILEPPHEIPSQPYLVMFWYALPLVSVYLIGRGTVDFLRLFFDRSERRNAWEEAVAMTYRNHVIVMGAGHLGIRVIRWLAQMGFQVVVIDSAIRPDPAVELKTLDVPLVIGDGRLPSVMETAGLRHAQAFIVCTSNDHLNLEVTMRARELNPDVRIVVRVWDNQFAAQIRHFMNVEAVLSASDLAAPAFAGAALNIEIAQSLRVKDVEYSIISLQVQPGSFLEGKTIGTSQSENEVDIVLHGRDGHLKANPPDNITVQAGDTLAIFAQPQRLADIVARNRRARTST